MKYLFLSFILFSSLSHSAPSEPPKDENPALFLEGNRELLSLSEMSKAGLNSGRTAIDLWSGNYWPHYQGLLASRYRDPGFIKLMNNEKSQFEDFKKYFEKAPLYSMYGKENNLSPAEKYDLLVGDPLMSLTKYSWKTAGDASSNGKVKTWRGICDGWASAAQNMPRPVKTVKLKTPGGQTITFYPEDIKALGSLSYGRSQGPVIFLGERCKGGVFKEGCEETNPATFHRALVNRVGRLKKSFIADVSPGGEVWNYPVESYSAKFYNVFSEEESDNFEDVKELFAKKGRFKKSERRHKNTFAIVGVVMTVRFRDMRPANLLETDSVANDKVLEKVYDYDLELDKNNNILGGESFSKNLPDFIWLPNDRTYPLSSAEEFQPELPMVKLSQESAKSGEPLASVIEKLFEAAK